MRQNILLTDQQNINISIPCEIMRSRRKTFSITLTGEGLLLIRVPLYVSDPQALSLLREKSGWILSKYKEYEERKKHTPPSTLSDTQRTALEKRYRDAAREYITERTNFYSALIQVQYAAIAIRDQKTRWGSCSGRGNLSFNWRLMLAPPAILDYVVVHELCHIKHMNHSRQFWSLVEQFIPDYREKRKWLKDHGNELTLA